MVRRYVVGVLACLAAVPMSLTGCAEKHEASQTLPPVSASASPTNALPAVGPADFPVPAEARQKTPDGVIAFADYYFALANRELDSMDSEPLRLLSLNCQTCTELADGYDRAKAAGHHYAGGTLSISSRGSAVITPTGGEMSFVLEQTALTVTDSSGSVVTAQTMPPLSFTGGIRLVWNEKHSTWLVAQLDADRI